MDLVTAYKQWQLELAIRSRALALGWFSDNELELK